MRVCCFLTVISLVALGCNGKDTGQGGTAANGEDAPTPQIEERTPEGTTDAAPGRAALDPVFKDYEYPGAKFESVFPMGNTVSAVYKSSDGFAEVMEFYKRKFPEMNTPVSGSTVAFGKQDADGSSVTVTLTRDRNVVQIIIKRSKPR